MPVRRAVFDPKGAVTMSADTTLTCRDCGQAFTFTSGEQDFYASRGFSDPSRCPDCRAARKAQRDAGSSYWWRVVWSCIQTRRTSCTAGCGSPSYLCQRAIRLPGVYVSSSLVETEGWHVRGQLPTV